MGPTADTLLTLIETEELKSLTWGYVDGSFYLEQLGELATKHFAGDHLMGQESIAKLIDRRLLLRVAAKSGLLRYRSRFAETVRLLSRLRQTFKHRPWTISPTLVSDFRVDVRTRRFPRRELNPETAVSQVFPQTISELEHSLWKALTEGLLLSGFQMRAAQRIIATKGSEGTIVTAGTGSGKTLAFYLPALLRLGLRDLNSTYCTRVIAVYPRSELLKDQFAECFVRVRSIDNTLKGNGKRKLSIGALFGSTPNRPSDVEQKHWLLSKLKDGHIFPIMGCPASGCDGRLVWLTKDRSASREILVCELPTCSQVIDGNEVRLTRQSLIAKPPDVLFTTTEMLNQRLSDVKMRRLFGVGVPIDSKPDLILLDEAHTYNGISGAQSALTLRRLKHAIGTAVPFVGLSATLANATDFFAELTGTAPASVSHITALPDELYHTSAEYQLLLRGDASTQTSLLSTSIQSAMLLARMLDPQAVNISDGRIGEKLFIFTDDLDATNRLYDDLRDAEAYTIWGRLDPSRSPLATLRDKSDKAKDDAGQSWEACEIIGRKLETPLQIGRTTSQDAGVAEWADVIVATSALEVGFNDPTVGAVLQHKAPRSVASFLQRKGRAGRSTIMRPFTVTVLSDYGRDRVAFQAFEHLFDPELVGQNLPFKNQYVLRIQAVYSFFDWVSHRLGNNDNIWAWDELSKPSAKSNVTRRIIELLENLLEFDAILIRDLSAWIGASLSVEHEAVQSLLYDPPRALLLEAIPTLLRRMQWDWKLAAERNSDKRDLQINFHPLPDFVPRQLFGELNLPEVKINIPPASTQHLRRTEYFPLLRALTDFAPGRVSRRFATERGKLSHWFRIDGDNAEQTLQVSDYCESDDLGYFGPTGVHVFRPRTLSLEQTKPADADPSSNAFLTWQTELIAKGTPTVVPTPVKSEWKSYVSEVRFHLHKFRGSVLVRRYATNVRAELKRKSTSKTIRVDFVDDNKMPAAVGYEFDADGLYLDISLPSESQLASGNLPQALNASCRSGFLRHLILHDSNFPRDVNGFQREWIFHILMAAAAIRTKETNAEFLDSLIASAGDPSSLIRVMNSMFLSQDPLATDAKIDHEDDAAYTKQISKLQKTLTEIVGRQDTQERLLHHARTMKRPNPEGWGGWLKSLLCETLGEAILQACISSAPSHVSTESLVLDIEPLDGCDRIWITESSMGGVGAVQAFADLFSNNPRLLFNAIEAALIPTDLEVASNGLDAYVKLNATSSSVSQAASKLRQAEGHSERATKREALWRELSLNGLDIPRVLSVSLEARIFRPGSSGDLDKFLEYAIMYWETVESNFMMAFSLREISVMLETDVKANSLLNEFLKAASIERKDTDLNGSELIASILWPRGVEIRQRALQSYNPFRSKHATDPAIVRHYFVNVNIPEICIETGEWQYALNTALAASGSVIIWVSTGPASESLLRSAIVTLISSPIEVGYLRFFPTIESISVATDRLAAKLSLRELM